MAPLNQEIGQDFAAALEAPALKPPDNVIPNFENPPNQNIYGYVALILCTALTSIFVLLRAYARVFYLKKVHLADFIGLLAFGMYIGFVYEVFTILETSGFFVHQWDMKVKNLVAFNELYFSGYMFYCATVLTIKTAIILEWVFIFVPQYTRNAFFWISYTLLGFNLLFYIAMMIFPNVVCHPHDKVWNPLLPGYCTANTSISSTLVSAVNFAVDIILIILPQRVIWSLQMSLKKKMGISLIFLIGILACVSAGFKLAASIPYNTSRDTSYTFAALALWSLAEITCGILIFCMPSIPKTIGDLRISGLASSLRSWAGSSMEKLKRSRSGSVTQVSWRGIKSRASKSSMQQDRAYRQMDKNIPPLPTEKSEPKTSGAESVVSERQVTSNSNEATIVRTTQFTADEAYGLDVSSDEYSRQHPWVVGQGEEQK
ncbi:hypothetical protein F5Y04DRAFT_288684 [Hypomontagnella monticulosa]|nr:hypothetical protein F5Y04DRAFT_288684 [Hypomontagnella monticulosa]